MNPPWTQWSVVGARPTALTVRGYRAFDQEATLEIAPITLLYGPNSAGKTSLLGALRLLSQSVDALVGRVASSEILTLNGPLVEMGTWRYVTSRHVSVPEVEFRLRLDVDLEAEAGITPTSPMQWGIGLTLVDNRLVTLDLEVEFPQDSAGVTSDESIELDYFAWVGRVSEDRMVTGSDDLRALLGVDESDPDDLIFDLAGALPYRLTSAAGDEVRQRWERLRSMVESALTSALGSVGGTASVRPVSRRADLTLVDDPDVSRTFSTEELINAWLLAAGLDRELVRMEYHLSSDVGDLRDRRVEQWLLRSRSSMLAVDLQDAGSGLGQVLPILLDMLQPARGVVLVEQPELHLHPRTQADFAIALAIARSIEPHPVVIVETHSEHLLYRLSRMIRSGEVPAVEQVGVAMSTLVDEDLAVNFVEQAGGRSTVTRLRTVGGALVDGWPRGVFDHDVQDFISGTRTARR